MGGRTEGLEPTAVHDILRNERRCLALRCLLEEGGPITVREMSERVAEMESGESPPPSELRKSVYVTLHQNHLSKMQEAGVVEYDHGSNQVRAGPGMEQLGAYFNETEADMCTTTCVVLSLAGVLVAAASILGMGGLSGVEAKGMTMGILYLILLVSTYSVLSRPRQVAVA